MKIELEYPQDVLLLELKQPEMTQRDVAITYAWVMKQQPGADWPRINRAIQKRWKGKTALARVKEMAWKFCYEEPARPCPECGSPSPTGCACG